MKTRLFRNLPYIRGHWKTDFCTLAKRGFQAGSRAVALALALCLWAFPMGCVRKEEPATFQDIKQDGEGFGGAEKERGGSTEGAVAKTVPKTVGASTVEAPEATTADVGAIRAAGPSQADEPVGALESSYPARGEGLPIPDKSSLVRVRDYIPDILVDLKYSTEDNFTGQKIYGFTEAYLRYGTIEKLRQAQDILKAQGMTLKIWDAYRPVSAQFCLWEVCPNSTYVANPNKGYSSHSRGNTVDVTLVAVDGGEPEMPTGFDDFSSRADRDYSDCSAAAAGNATLLENTMEQCGFKPYSGEWWHFSDVDPYPVEEDFEIGKGP